MRSRQEDHDRWSARFGTSVTPTLGADGNGDGAVNAADYVMWRKLFDAAQGSGGGAAAAAATVAESPAATVAESPMVVESPSAADPSDEAKASQNPSDEWFALPVSENVADRFWSRMSSGSSRIASLTHLDRANLVDALFDADCRRRAEERVVGSADEAGLEHTASFGTQENFDDEVWSNASWVSSKSWLPRLAKHIAM